MTLPQPLAPTEAFLDAVNAYGIAFESGDLEQLGLYLALLLETNKQFNLTGFKDPSVAWMRLIFDSLTLMPLLDALGASSAKNATNATNATRVIDVGSGGGLPGIPLAIIYPDIEFTLLEATGKKARFLHDAAAALERSNIVVVNARAETAGQDRETHRDRYDVVTARAVGKLAELLELTIPLAKVGGLVLAIKGDKAPQEVEEAEEALRILNASVVDQVRTPNGTIVVIEKRRATPKLYPRRPGEPHRAPLGKGE